MKIKYLLLSFSLLFQFSIFASDETDSLKNCLANEENHDQIVDLRIEISEAYLSLNVDSSIHYISKLNVENNPILGLKRKEKIAGINTGIAWVNYRKGYYRNSEFYFHKALSFYNQVHDTLSIGQTYYGLALGNKYWGKYRKAVSYAQKSLKNFQMLNYKIEIADIYLLFGYIYSAWDNFELSEYYCNNAFEVLEDVDDKSVRIGYAYLLKGKIHWGRLNTDSAIVFYKKALQIFQNEQDFYGMGLCYRDFASYHIHKNNFAEANQMLNKSYDIFVKLNYKRSLCEIYTLKGEYFTQCKMYDEAIVWYKKGMDLAVSMELHEHVIKSYKLVSEAYESLNNEKTALTYFKLYNSLKDSIFSIEQHEQIVDLQTKYEAQKKEQENIILKKELELKEINEQKSKALQRYLFILLAIFVLIIGLLYILVKLRSKSLAKTHQLRLKEKQLADIEIKNKKMLLAHKNEKLSSTILHLINKNETLGKLKKIVFTEHNKTNPNYNESYTTLISIINSNIDNDMGWKKFMHNFENLHHGFIDRLLEKHPDLSEKEQMLCVCLKTNISSQEISQIMNITTESVSKNRQRLRKKLNFNAQLNLKEYIQKI